ncbi:uncharacterized protein tedc2 isoform X2 [Halichoeres trimaculatus]|uniref:uncharacterized protein tedc2 isoform X2 n=1 Tax=Halichoeres trimaculatus TaxID=147232 RepID=UPI003D9E2131
MADRRPGVNMSLLSIVERSIKSCKAEQARINSTIQLYRELLQAVTPQPEREESDCIEDAATDTSPGDREDIELLERALEKALQVRTGTGHSKKDPERHQVPAQPKAPATKQTCAVSRVNQTTRSTSKSAGLDRKENKKSGISLSSSKTSMKVQQGASASGSLCQGPLHASSLHAKKQTSRSNKLSVSKVGQAVALSTPSSNSTVSVSHAGGSEAPRMPPQNGIAGDQIAKWKSLHGKKNRLWDKVVAVQRKPVPGRSHFMERMRATFPEDWPRSCPDQTRAQVNRLTHKGLDLAQQCHIKELLAKQNGEAAATELGGEKMKPDSSLTQEKMQMIAAELRNSADQIKEEWEAWDRWRPEGGCLCPTGVNGVWGDVIIAPLPLTVTYTTEAELREVETLRMRVALLQQDINLEQALLETLTPQLLSAVPGPGSSDISMLRDMYSLLGEGGERFPSVVLDSEPD